MRTVEISTGQESLRLIKSGQIPDFNTVMDEFNRDGSISNAFHAEYEKQLMLNTVVTDDEHPSMDGHRKGRQWRA